MTNCMMACDSRVQYLQFAAVELEDLQILPALEISRQRWQWVEAAGNSKKVSHNRKV